MVYIILGQGFEEMEAICPCDMLRRGGVDVQFAGIGGIALTFLLFFLFYGNLLKPIN